MASPAESATPTYIPPSASLVAIPGYKKLSSLAIDPDDAITLRARVIKFKYPNADDQDESDNISTTLGRLIIRITDKATLEKDLLPALVELASLFGSPHTSVSSFELLQSGVVDGLLQFLTDIERTGANTSECF